MYMPEAATSGRSLRRSTLGIVKVQSAMSDASAGSICIGHFNQPSGSTYEGLAQAIPALKASGLVFARLDEMTLK